MTRRIFSSCRGQGMVEFALILPFLLLIMLGVMDVGYALLNQHVVTKLSREGSNLISRDTTLEDAAFIIRSLTARPVNFDDGSSRVFFSVIRQGNVLNTANYGEDILAARHNAGTLSATGVASFIQTGGGSYRAEPNFEAINPDTDARLQISNMPPNLVLAPGGVIYVTEVFTRHEMITPLNRFGVTLPDTLYSVSFF
jgi:hypothetical protein